ncbi:MAG: hypothetical protein ACKVUT_18325 [Gaiella sp.]
MATDITCHHCGLVQSGWYDVAFWRLDLEDDLAIWFNNQLAAAQ